jgi:hypothetical protein
MGENASEHTHACRGTSEGSATANSDCGTRHCRHWAADICSRFVNISQQCIAAPTASASHTTICDATVTFQTSTACTSRLTQHCENEFVANSVEHQRRGSTLLWCNYREWRLRNIYLVLYFQSTRRSLPQTSSAFFLPFVSGTYHEMKAKKKADNAAKIK